MTRLPSFLLSDPLLPPAEPCGKDKAEQVVCCSVRRQGEGQDGVGDPQNGYLARSEVHELHRGEKYTSNRDEPHASPEDP